MIVVIWIGCEAKGKRLERLLPNMVALRLPLVALVSNLLPRSWLLVSNPFIFSLLLVPMKMIRS